MFRKAFSAGSDQKIKLLEEKLMYKTYWAIFANFTGILLKLGRHHEIWPLSRPQIFLGRKYFYRATFELCGLEISHLAAVTK